MKLVLMMLSTLLLSWPAFAQEHVGHLPQGGRTGLHGMVVVGSGRYFLEHIPMMTPPHDFQIIKEVVLKDGSGRIVQADFSKGGFTLKPAQNFSLNDYVSGRLTKFTGSIHQGSFEQNGPVVPGLASVTVEVKSSLLSRQLPANAQTEWFRFSDGTSTFASKLIRGTSDIQLLKNETHNTTLWCVKGPDFFEPCLH